MYTDVSEEPATSVIIVMEEEDSSETSIYIYIRTRLSSLKTIIIFTSVPL
jgi:hypothetical protein